MTLNKVGQTSRVPPVAPNRNRPGNDQPSTTSTRRGTGEVSHLLYANAHRIITRRPEPSALSAAIAELKASDATHLSIFASPALATYGRLADLAAEIDRYRFFCRVPEPPGSAERGIHVDPLWF